MSQRLGLTLTQQAVADKSHELGHIQDVLAALILEGTVITTDALHTQRQVAATLIANDREATGQQRLDHGGLVA